ncbi:DUF5681 domain-containing protein [Terricaulis silvestris]|uniref:DUF5681 domain-containing protein n=1 Tax=Terricaulis silvestris TaxID=2686094 RepID=A0A6I6MV10_9CAUL|nr:DUF5681 domain-containing protein [Terricaulis silvestris]QGZ96597.1 hypothetical protein DSM104635_03457 [Terricaulis silvestris]
MSTDRDYEVGYGRPPKTSQFKKGRSGNPSGRPKTKGAVAVDLEAMLNAPVTTIDPTGRTRRISRSEALLRKQVDRALGGDLRALSAVFKQLIKHDALKLGEEIHDYGAVVVPKDIPMDLARILVPTFGKPPWSTKEIVEASIIWEKQSPADAAPFIAKRRGKP